tara:strand:+ start:71 stop:199 length:129 start_codon:yes stop_codon:yes gene_type:complete
MRILFQYEVMNFAAFKVPIRYAITGSGNNKNENIINVIVCID